MPTYVYECKGCSHSFEELQSIKSSPLVTCPECSKDELVKVICPTFVRGSPTTLGGLAEANTKKMGRYELEDKRRSHKDKELAARNEMRRQAAAKHGKAHYDVTHKSDPKEAALMTKLGNMDQQQINKYIATGQTE